ncbi:MAG TPA: hypothetical protein VGH87_31070 [Polyangiaceae bacterium]
MIAPLLPSVHVACCPVHAPKAPASARQSQVVHPATSGAHCAIGGDGAPLSLGTPPLVDASSQYSEDE